MSIPFAIPASLRRDLSWQEREAATQGQVLDFVFDGTVHRGPSHRRSTRRSLGELRCLVEQQAKNGDAQDMALAPLLERLTEGLERALLDHRLLVASPEPPGRSHDEAQIRLRLYETARCRLERLDRALAQEKQAAPLAEDNLLDSLDAFEEAICAIERQEE